MNNIMSLHYRMHSLIELSWNKVLQNASEKTITVYFQKRKPKRRRRSRGKRKPKRRRRSCGKRKPKRRRRIRRNTIKSKIPLADSQETITVFLRMRTPIKLSKAVGILKRVRHWIRDSVGTTIVFYRRRKPAKRSHNSRNTVKSKTLTIDSMGIISCFCEWENL
jgi:hypothetical protein